MSEEWIPVEKPPIGKLRNIEEEKILKTLFTRKIFVRGLYALADDSTKKTLTLKENGIFVGTLWIMGRLMITIDEGEGTENYKQITFICASDDPLTLNLNTYEGEYEELYDLIERAACFFEDLKNIPLTDGSVVFAGIKIGED